MGRGPCTRPRHCSPRAPGRRSLPRGGAGPGSEMLTEVLTEVLTGTGQAEPAPGAHLSRGHSQVWLLCPKAAKPGNKVTPYLKCTRLRKMRLSREPLHPESPKVESPGSRTLGRLVLSQQRLTRTKHG